MLHMLCYVPLSFKYGLWKYISERRSCIVVIAACVMFSCMLPVYKIRGKTIQLCSRGCEILLYICTAEVRSLAPQPAS